MLKKEDIIHLSKEPILDEFFSKIKYDFYEPSLLSNIIFSVFKNDNINIFKKKILEIINLTRCQFIQIRFEKNFSKKGMNEILNSLDKSIVKSISIIINHNDCIKNDFELILDSFPRILNVIIYNFEKDLSFIDKNEYKHIEFIKLLSFDFPYFNKLNDLRFLYMNPNIRKFSEAQNHNLYYHKKAYIESNGNVFNSPCTKKNYGNVFNESITDIIQSSNFSKYWYISKNLIRVCKDCEYRYSCVDERIPLENKNVEKEYHFLTECKYDPFKNTFNEE